MPEISSELNELFENWTRLNAPRRKFWKIDSKILMDRGKLENFAKSNQKSVMDEKNREELCD